MSRIGKMPISIPENTTISLEGNAVNVKGPKGELSQELSDHVTLDIQEKHIEVKRKDDSKESRARHGLFRSLINNMVIGVNEGYKKELELIGVGFRATATGQNLELVIGFSHNVLINLPDEIKVTATGERGQNPTVVLESHDKQLIGMVASKIRSLRKPEPYKGKGIRYKDEYVRRKAGKSAAK
ncbi:MAG: 50S ribosomal protein L6 [Crocinitomicaceae bacterium]|nr:50S ribosomal protein L6 [Crocinitomicaceae bacterium]|tara:strand:+ start:8994 stop:9545 length:552 start_codon:yes stop_codon:yes gene_type:complete